MYIGDTTAGTVTLPGPTTVISGTEVFFLSPTIAKNLVVVGDGTTTTISNSINSASDVQINDSVIVSGSQTVTAAGAITVEQPVGTIDGTTAGLDSLTLDAGTSVYVQGNIGAGTQMDNFNVTAGGNVDLAGSMNLAGNLDVTNAASVTFGGGMTINGNVTLGNLGTVGSVSFDGPVTINGNLTIDQASTVTFLSNVRVTGNITIDPNRNASKSAVILTITNGAIKYIQTVAP